MNSEMAYWRETCKPCDVVKSKWPREEMSPMLVCLCEGRRRKVKVRWKNLQSKHNHQYHRVILGNFFISFHIGTLRGIKSYTFPWYLTLVSANHASSNPGLDVLNLEDFLRTMISLFLNNMLPKRRSSTT